MEVKTRTFTGPRMAGMLFRGRSTRFTQKTPRGGIHAVASMRPTVIADCDGELTYSTQALQKTVRMKLRRGVTMQPNRAKGAGKKRMRLKLNRVRTTPWTMPKVMRRT
jgi:hypothetical protein